MKPDKQQHYSFVPITESDAYNNLFLSGEQQKAYETLNKETMTCDTCILIQKLIVFSLKKKMLQRKLEYCLKNDDIGFKFLVSVSL